MITNDALGEEQQRETSNVGAAASLQVAVPLSDQVVNVSSLSSSDESSTSEDEDDGKQVAEVGAQASTENPNKIINTFQDCTNVNSTVNNTTVYEDGVTVINNVYCCSASLGYVFKRLAAKRRLFISIALVSGVLIFIIFLGLWISDFAKTNENSQVISTTEKVPQSTTIVIPPTSTTTTDVTLSSSTDSSSSTSENPNQEWRIITRKDWEAAPATKPPVQLVWLPPLYVIFSETETDMCTTTQKCMETVRDIQTAHMKGGEGDIAYNFLIGGDGMVYEGRGWDVAGRVKDYDTEDFDDMSLSVSFIGKFDNDAPTEIILQAAQMFLKFGSQIEKLVADPKLKCLRQLSHTIKNPGDQLYEILKTWKGWDPRTIQSFQPRPNYNNYYSLYVDYANTLESSKKYESTMKASGM